MILKGIGKIDCNAIRLYGRSSRTAKPFLNSIKLDHFSDFGQKVLGRAGLCCQQQVALSIHCTAPELRTVSMEWHAWLHSSCMMNIQHLLGISTAKTLLTKSDLLISLSALPMQQSTILSFFPQRHHCTSWQQSNLRKSYYQTRPVKTHDSSQQITSPSANGSRNPAHSFMLQYKATYRNLTA